MRCPGTLCKSCDLEESLTLRSTTHRTQSLDLKSLDAAFIPPPFNSHPFTNDILKGVHSFQTFETDPSLPLYLQNLTFLC